MQHHPRHQVGDYIADRYRVDQILPGGMAEVYRCLDIALDEEVAVKTFKEGNIVTSELHELLITEARTWLMLKKHPNIVQAKSAFMLDQRPYIILEWVAGDEKYGSSLRTRLKEGPIQVSAAIDYAIQACYGLGEAFRQLYLIHRDIKPDNLLIDENGTLKVTDFGLAHLLGSDRGHSKQNRIEGTPPYMSPEHWLNVTPSIQADIYGIGCVIFEMLTRRVPFPAEKIEQWRDAHLNTPPPDIQSFAPETPEGLQAIVTRCLDKNPNKRFLSYEDLIEHLKVVYTSLVGSEYNRSSLVDKALGEASESELLNIGNILLSMGQYEDAMRYFQRALDLAPGSAVAWLRKAECLGKRNSLHEAYLYFKRATELEPSNLEVATSATKWLMEFIKNEEALVHCNRALAIYPNNKELLLLKRELIKRLSINIAKTSTTQQVAVEPATSTDISGFDKNVLASLLGDLSPIVNQDTEDSSASTDYSEDTVY